MVAIKGHNQNATEVSKIIGCDLIVDAFSLRNILS